MVCRDFGPAIAAEALGGTLVAPLVLRHLGVIVVARSAHGGMLFHDQSTWGEDTDDSDDESKCAEVTAWKFGPAKKSHA